MFLGVHPAVIFFDFEDFLLDLAGAEREEYYMDQYSKASQRLQMDLRWFEFKRSCEFLLLACLACQLSEKPDLILIQVEQWKANRETDRDRATGRVWTRSFLGDGALPSE